MAAPSSSSSSWASSSTSFVAPDPFAALGLDRHASRAAIKARYYALARKYHPNRVHGSEEAQRALAAHFHRIYDAWALLSSDSRRRRYVDWLELAELEASVDAHRIELEYLDQHGGDDADTDDGWSSDVDDFDLTHLSRVRRARSPATAGDDTPRAASPALLGQSPRSSEQEQRGRGAQRRVSHPAADKLQQQQQQQQKQHDHEGSDAQSAAERRKRLDRMKRKEMDAFEQYRDAKLAEIDAQIKAERLKDLYERTKAKREKIERMPRGASSRMRLVQTAHTIISLLRSQATRRPHRLTVSTAGGLMSTAGEGDFIGVSSPLSARTGLASHRIGWSSDISGDQTDSDEDDNIASGPSRIRLRSRTPTGRIRPIRDASPLPSPPPSHLQPNGTQHAPRPDSKFRLLVKRPTGFEDLPDTPDTPDTPELLGDGTYEDMASSSASFTDAAHPFSSHPANTCRDLIRIDSESMATMAEGHGHHKRSISAPDTMYWKADSDSDRSRSPLPASMFTIKQIDELRFPTRIPFAHIHKLDMADESRLLGKPPDTNAQPEDLLQRLTAWDSAVASRFMVKPDIKARFAFRLLCSNREHVRRQNRSFIALSYRRKRIVEKHGESFTLPLSKEMFQAVWEERISDDEGLWIDQCCIKQDDDYEKTVSMSAMDLVYRGARLIVVVLDDIEFKQYESEVLENHVREYERMRHVAPNKRFRRHQPPWLEAHEDLFNVLTKLLSASWFRRAWCRHEMRLARDHVFLIPCHTAGSFRTTVLRLTSPCIAHLLALGTEVPFNARIEQLKPSLHAFFRDRTQTLGHGHAAEMRSHHGNFTTVAAEVFGMEAGGDPRLPESQREADARWDKMSIILNAMECGLTLQSTLRTSRISLSKEDCYYSLLMLALAARDPGALCSVGRSLLLTPPAGHIRPMSSWLFEPTVVDAGLNNYRTLDRLPQDCHMQTGISRGAHWVQLDLKFLRRHTIKTADECADTLAIARDLVRRCEADRLGRHRRRYLLNDAKATETFGSMREVYVETLACVFHCGPDWLASLCQRYGVGRWRQDLEPACWLLVALRGTYGKWPELAPSGDWTGRAAGFLMDFANFLVIRGLPQRQLKRPERWRPVWVTTPNFGRVLTFCPARDGDCGGGEIHPVVPSVLLDADYLHLARLWILEPRTTADKWTLLGKSVLFSDDLAMQTINQADGMRLQQKVYGRVPE